MTEDQYQKAQAIEKFVTFLPASYDKRFARSMASIPKDKELSEKQAIYLEQMWHKYRNQIPNHKEICKVCSGEIKAYKKYKPSLEDNRKLAEWKAVVQQTNQEQNSQDPQLPLFK